MKRLIIAAVALAMAVGAPALGGQAKTNAKSDSAKIRDKVAKCGIGHRVTVVLRNGNEYYGAISDTAADSFELSEIDLNQKVTIAYGDVKAVRSGFGNPNPFNGKRWHPRCHLAATLIVVGLTTVLIVAGATAGD